MLVYKSVWSVLYLNLIFQISIQLFSQSHMHTNKYQINNSKISQGWKYYWPLHFEPIGNGFEITSFRFWIHCIEICLLDTTCFPIPASVVSLSLIDREKSVILKHLSIKWPFEVIQSADTLETIEFLSQMSFYRK